MEKFQSMIHLIGSKGVVGIYKTIEEMKHDIRNRIEANEFGYEEVGDDLRILNVTHHVHQGHGFDIEVLREMPEVDIEDNKCYDSGKYRIKNGKFRGEEFSDQDDLKDFLRSEWRDGNLTLEELRDITIEITEESIFEFYDHTETNEADLEIDDVNITFGEKIDLNVFGKEFVLAESLMYAQPTPEQALIPTKEYQALLKAKDELVDAEDKISFLTRELEAKNIPLANQLTEIERLQTEVETLKNNLVTVTTDKTNLEEQVIGMDNTLSTTSGPAFILNKLNNLDPNRMTELELRQMLNTFNNLMPDFYLALAHK